MQYCITSIRKYSGFLMSLLSTWEMCACVLHWQVFNYVNLICLLEVSLVIESYRRRSVDSIEEPTSTHELRNLHIKQRSWVRSWGVFPSAWLAVAPVPQGAQCGQHLRRGPEALRAADVVRVGSQPAWRRQCSRTNWWVFVTSPGRWPSLFFLVFRDIFLPITSYQYKSTYFLCMYSFVN